MDGWQYGITVTVIGIVGDEQVHSVIVIGMQDAGRTTTGHRTLDALFAGICISRIEVKSMNQ